MNVGSPHPVGWNDREKEKVSTLPPSPPSLYLPPPLPPSLVFVSLSLPSFHPFLLLSWPLPYPPQMAFPQPLGNFLENFVIVREIWLILSTQLYTGENLLLVETLLPLKPSMGFRLSCFVVCEQESSQDATGEKHQTGWGQEVPGQQVYPRGSPWRGTADIQRHMDQEGCGP